MKIINFLVIATRNRFIDIKKAKYEASEILMTNYDLINFINEKNNSWNEKIINERSKKLAEKILEDFNIFI